MEIYDIFKSEGGYRVCGATWAGGPVIDSSPWFATMEEAEAHRDKMRRRDRYGYSTSCLFDVPSWFIKKFERGDFD